MYIMASQLKICIICRKEFSKPNSCSKIDWFNRKFCSRKCYDESVIGTAPKFINNKGRVSPTKLSRIKICECCGKEYTPPQRGNRWKKQRFCSDICRGNSFPPWNKGIPCSKETIDKISESNKGKHSGDKASCWKGGVTPLRTRIRTSPKYLEWRYQIRGRDNWTCQHCGIRGVWVEAHHIKEFAQILQEQNITSFEGAMDCIPLWNLGNGITLCENCHDKITFKNEEHVDV